ncbi:MAG: GspE/PulE/PilB domain-containing protein [Planctomycetota bacterium]|jgi:hypothetical protein
MKKFDKIFKKRFEKILIDSGLINMEIAEHAQSVSAESGKLIGDVLVEQGYVKEEDIARELSAQLQLPFLMLENYNISKGMTDNLPSDILHRYQILPVDLFGDTMSVAMSQHLTLDAFREVQEKSSHDVTFFVALISKVRSTLDELVPIDDSKLQEIRKQKAVETTKPASWTDIFDTANKSVMGMDALQKKDKEKDKAKKGLDIFDSANTKVMKQLQPKPAVPKGGQKARPKGSPAVNPKAAPKAAPQKPAGKSGGGLDIFDSAQKKVSETMKKKVVPKGGKKIVPKPKKKDT